MVTINLTYHTISNWKQFKIRIPNLKKLLRRRSICKFVSERFPMLRQHTPIRISDFNTIIRNLIMRSSDHNSDHWLRFQRSQSRQNSNSVHCRRQNRCIFSKPRCTIGYLHSYTHTQNSTVLTAITESDNENDIVLLVGIYKSEIAKNLVRVRSEKKILEAEIFVLHSWLQHTNTDSDLLKQCVRLWLIN